ncbi:hypothetical protein, variant 1 [Capsaspora owczarzaki ATCC 30864]|uniref:Mediator complex subunit 16 n=1 Tax=Capsaspora owczarzaki (strain ATCC 30864) TaxID=595528 RepID=A0A0D2WXL5_CAPO3|nr:hypothetical protein, variant 1 [Capsaspora owczarzaki ATCC 30864]
MVVFYHNKLQHPSIEIQTQNLYIETTENAHALFIIQSLFCWCLLQASLETCLYCSQMRDETIVYDVAWSALQPQLLHASLQPVHSISTPTTGSSGSAGSRRPDARQLRQELTAQPAYQCIDWSARNLIAFATCSRVLPLATTLQSVAGTGAGASLPTGSAGVAGGPPASMNTVTAGPSSAANQANPNPTQSTSSAAGTAPSVQEASGEMRLHTIHIMDPNTPWAMCSLAQEHHTRPIKTLKWSGSGFQLISIDDGGTLCLWRMRSHLANEWYCEHTQSYGTDESVVAAVWLENGLVHKPPTVVDDMSDASLARSYSEKFSHSFSTVPLGAPSTSWLLLTSSGKLFLTSRINSSSSNTSIALLRQQYCCDRRRYCCGEMTTVVATCGTPTDSLEHM